MSVRRAALAINLALLAALGLAHAPLVPDLIRMIAAGALVLVLPGVGWLGMWRRPLDAPRLALAIVGMSSLATLLGLGLLALGPGDPSFLRLAVWTVLFTNGGLLLARFDVRLDRDTPWRPLAALMLAGTLLAAVSGLHLVPPLEDHDMEVRGTAWGLATDARPWFLTNRDLWLPFAHPILFHVHVAASLVHTGEIEATRPSFESAHAAADAAVRDLPFDTLEQWRADHRLFVERPALAGTRAPAALFAGLLLVLLAELVRRSTGSLAAGLGAALLHAALPQALVRSAYAGYFSVTVCAMLLAVLLLAPAAPGRDAGAWLAAAGLFASLVDHKTVVLMLAAGALWALRRVACRPHGPFDRGVLALGGGFTVGTLLWWAYGFAVHPGFFIRDHLRMHIAHRFLLNDVRLGADPGRYAPSILELWGEFAAHTGWLLLPVAAVGCIVALGLWRHAPGQALPAAWVLTGIVLYTLTDWRQTKHLMNQAAPLIALAVTFAWPAVRSGGIRRLALAALLLSFGVNLYTDVRLARDFGSLRILGASDVDGW